MCQNKHAFTLIELLVVVLIIGILAAVALPQYQKAVLKSRVSTIFPILKSLTDAAEVYYLANGEYTDEMSALDITVPSNCTAVNHNSTTEKYWNCGDFLVYIKAGGHATTASYCPGYTSSYEDCAETRDLLIVFYYSRNSHNIPNLKICSGVSDLGKAVCNSLSF